MKPYRCIIADDNELDRLTLTHYLSSFPEIEIAGTFENSLEALNFIQNENLDIIFLDVDMPGMNGLELRKKVSEIPVCIFQTDHPEFALESFELETLDYLLKPYSLERFSKTIERIYEYMDIRTKAAEFESKTEKTSFFIKDGHKKVKINVDEILYLNALQNYTILITQNEKQYVLSTIGNLLNEKHFQNFVRIHKSYAVQKKHVKSFDAKEITLINNEKIPIGRSYRTQIEILFDNHNFL